MKNPAEPPDNNVGTENMLQSILQHLYTLHRTEIDLSLERLPSLLHTLGNPHLHLPPVIHVAGTNGKGSTCALLRSLLEAHGYRVHVATSPHLVKPHERIRLAGELISSEHLLQVLQETLAAVGDNPITFFEAFMAASFLAFARTPADFCLLETGMGGRLDATNVVPNPVCTLITAISLDHREFLGETYAQIAREKAGIMKPGVPCVIGYQYPLSLAGGVMDVFQDISRQLSPVSPLYRGGAEWRVEPETDRFRFIFESSESILTLPGLQGLHQIYNAGNALAAYHVILKHKNVSPLPDENLSTALRRVDWPGRLQTLPRTHAYYQHLPPGAEIIIDGGHNDSAGVVLAEQARQWKELDPDRPLHLVVAMMARKNPREFLSPLLPFAESVTVTTLPGEKGAYPVQDLASVVSELRFTTLYQAETPALALRNQAFYSGTPRILMTGSLYLMGQILATA